jgi:fermentation-respiration switch protein FrsA (DUF1100 family)
MKRLLIILTLPLLFSSCISYHITEKDLFKINKISRLNNDVHLEEIYFTTTDSVNIYGWFIKHKNARGTLLYFGGDGFFLWNSLTPDVINMLTSFKMNLMLIDYRGYGRSEGNPTIQGIYNDGNSTYKYLCSRGDVDSTRIIVYGHSLGTIVAIRLGNTSPVAGVVLEGVISNTKEMRDVALKYNAPWYLRWLVTIDADSVVMSLDNIKQVNNLNCPLLVVTGEKDNIAPPEMGKKVFEAAYSSIKRFEIIPNGEHKDLYFSNKGGRRDFYIKVLSKYLDDILGEQ